MFEGANQQSARQALDSHATLLNLIDELRRVESTCNPRLPSRNDQTWANFFKWIDGELSVNLSSKVGVADKNSSPDGDRQEYSLIAKVPFKNGESIFSVDRKVMLSTETVIKDQDLFEFIENDSIASAMQNVVLVLHLLNEYSKGETSYWSSYLNIMPNKILPVLTLTKEKLKLLEASAHIFEILKMIRAIARQYSYFFKRLQSTNLPLSNDFTFEYYCWGVSIVCSRQNEIPPLDRGTCQMPVIHALIPILDMCNHNHTSRQATFENNQSRLLATRDLNVDEEIAINYGCRSSGEFYIHNGFVPEQVPFDVVPLTIVLNEQNPSFEAKAKLLKTLRMPTFGRFRLTYNNYDNRHKKDPHLTMFLIVYFLTDAELELIAASDNPVGIADEIYEFIQYSHVANNDVTTNNGDKTTCNNEKNRSEIVVMRERLNQCFKEYLSKRSSIAIALIDRTLSDDKLPDQDASTMLKHERSIYESYLINRNSN